MSFPIPALSLIQTTNRNQNNGIELEAIEPHPEKEDTQIFTFRDRGNAEKVCPTPSPPYCVVI